MNTATRRGAGMALALVAGATFVVLPAMLACAHVAYQYHVLKQASEDAALYMTNLASDAAGHAGAAAPAPALVKQMMIDAVAAAGISAPLEPAHITLDCDGTGQCSGAGVPRKVTITASMAIGGAGRASNAALRWFGASEGGAVSGTTTIAYAR